MQIAPSANPRARALLAGAAVVAGTFAVVAWRRPDQLLTPYVWDEDGTVNLPRYAAHGLGSILEPLNGYFVVPAKLVFALATKLTFLHQPVAAYWLTVAFTAAVVACVAFSPTTLRWPGLCAAAMLLVPTDAEAFGVGLYTLWWGTALCVLPLLWRDDARGGVAARCAMVTVGGLSSPLIIPLAALYVARLVRRRTRAEATVLAVAAVTAAAQLAALRASGALGAAPDRPESLATGAVTVLAKFLGWYVELADLPVAAAVGAALVAFVTWRWIRFRSRLAFQDLLLVACLAAAILAAVQRRPLAVLDPLDAGPRYFLLPYAFLSWILIQTAAVADRWSRVAVAAVLVLALRQTAAYGQRYHYPFDWAKEARACMRSEIHRFPVHYDGDPREAWSVVLSGATCTALVSGSLLDRFARE